MAAYNEDLLSMERAYLLARQRDISRESLGLGVVSAVIEANMTCIGAVRVYACPSTEGRLYVPSVQLTESDEVSHQLLGLTGISVAASGIAPVVDAFYPVGVIQDDGEFYPLGLQDSNAAEVVHRAAVSLVMDRDEVIPHLSANLLRIEAYPTLL